MDYRQGWLMISQLAIDTDNHSRCSGDGTMSVFLGVFLHSCQLMSVFSGCSLFNWDEDGIFWRTGERGFQVLIENGGVTRNRRERFGIKNLAWVLVISVIEIGRSDQRRPAKTKVFLI